MPKSKLTKSFMFRKIHSQILPFFVAFSIVIIIANLLTGCGTSPGNTDSGTTDNNESNIIGSAGGTVTSSNGKVKIVIPSGALNKDTEITFSAASNQPSGNIGTAYEVNPDGATFNKPVTISITYDEASLPSGVSESDIKLGTVTNNKWEVITDSFVNTTSNTISGSITHLSTYGIMAVNIGSVPAAPTGIAATAGDGKVTISWNAVSWATSYNIYWSATSGVTKTTGTKIADATTLYTHTGRNNGTTYYYVVTAVNIYGEGGESVQVSAKPAKLDTTPPDTSITDKPSSLSNSSSAGFSFSSTETGASFQCQIDDGDYSTCTSPKSYTGLTDGSHTFEVRSTNASGNADITPANYTWGIDATSPSNTTGNNFINSGAASTNLINVTLSISATDIVGVTGYYVSETLTTPSASAAGWVAVTSVTSYSTNVSFALSSGDGLKTLYVWFKDATGNVSTSKSDTITLQNTIPKADAGPDQIVSEGTVVTLNGSGSSDLNGDPLTYQWTLNSIPNGSSAKLTLSNTASSYFIPDIEGDYVAQLIVNDGKDNSPPDEVRVTAIKSKKITIKGPINSKVVYGNVHYLGQMINETDYAACFIKITIDSMDTQNKLIDTDFTYVDGSTMVVSNTIYTDTCLRSGEIGGFEVYTDLAEIPAKFVHVINFDSSEVSEPIIFPSQVIIDGQISETTNYFGNLELRGFIKNLHPNITIQFVEISIVALNGDKVVDTDYTYINGSSCTLSFGGTTDTCLAPGESRSFSVIIDVPPSEVTDYYYKINYDISK